MNEDDMTPRAYVLRTRMLELLEKAITDGSFNTEGWNPYELGFMVFGGDSLLQQNLALVADIVGHELGGPGISEDDRAAIIRGMESRMYADEFNQD